MVITMIMGIMNYIIYNNDDNNTKYFVSDNDYNKSESSVMMCHLSLKSSLW